MSACIRVSMAYDWGVEEVAVTLAIPRGGALLAAIDMLTDAIERGHQFALIDASGHAWTFYPATIIAFVVSETP
jgi:hypothetical protein